VRLGENLAISLVFRLTSVFLIPAKLIIATLREVAFHGETRLRLLLQLWLLLRLLNYLATVTTATTATIETSLAPFIPQEG
jgi:hypothetical protein